MQMAGGAAQFMDAEGCVCGVVTVNQAPILDRKWEGTVPDRARVVGREWYAGRYSGFLKKRLRSVICFWDCSELEFPGRKYLLT